MCLYNEGVLILKSIFIVILLSLTLFGTQNSTYEKHPEQEFYNGHIKKYVSDGSGKTQGLKFSFSYPSSWVSKEAHRPHIVRVFQSQFSNGMESAMIMIHNLPTTQSLSKNQLESLAKQILSRHPLPPNAILKDSGFTYLETLPGYWERYTMIGKRLNFTLKIECLKYVFLYKNKMIIFQFVSSTPNGKGTEQRFRKFKPLFNSMLNSFVLYNIYMNK